MKKIFSVLLVLSVMAALLASCGFFYEVYDFYAQSGSPAIVNNASATAEVVSEQSEAPLKINKDLRIVALGDSITRGYALEQPERERFTTLVSEHLEKIFSNVEMTNYAVDGLTSGGLLALLNSGKAEKLKDADIVMLCIGANNVLQYAPDLFFYDDTDVEGLFHAYGSFLMSDRSDTTAPEAVKRYFDKINEYAASQEFSDKIESGLLELRQDIPRIVSYIRGVNPTAKIYYANVYSPYSGMNIDLPYVDTVLPLGDLSDGYVGKINRIIDEFNADCGYTVVDVYTVFKNSGESITNAGLNLSRMALSFDPHPNKKGHSLIADEYKRIITEDSIK